MSYTQLADPSIHVATHLLGGLLYDRLGRSRGSLHGDEGGGLVGGDVVVVLRLRRRLRMLMWL